MLLLLFGIIIINSFSLDKTVEYTAPEAQNEPVEVVEELDVVEAAKLELERISAELDAEVTLLETELDSVEIEYKTKTDEISQRLDEIIAVRASL